MNAKETFQLLVPNPENIHWIRHKNYQILQKYTNISQSSQIREVIELSAKQWFFKRQNYKYLLRGESLIFAEKFYTKSGDCLSINARKYIISCIENRDRITNKPELNKFLNAVTATIGVISISSLSMFATLHPTTPLQPILFVTVLSESIEKF